MWNNAVVTIEWQSVFLIDFVCDTQMFLLFYKLHLNLKKLIVRLIDWLIDCVYITIKTFNLSSVISFYSYADIMKDSIKCKMRKGLGFEKNEKLFTTVQWVPPF